MKTNGRRIPGKMVLLDTCTLLWLSSDQKLLSQKAKETISKNANKLYISSITSLEISLKHNKGKLTLPLSPKKWIQTALMHHGIIEIPVDTIIAVKSTGLPQLHNDPADRIIIATSLIHDMLILSPDHLIKQYPKIKVLW